MTSWLYVAGKSSIREKRYSKKPQCTFQSFSSMIDHTFALRCNHIYSLTNYFLGESALSLAATVSFVYLKSTKFTSCNSSESTARDSSLIPSLKSLAYKMIATWAPKPACHDTDIASNVL